MLRKKIKNAINQFHDYNYHQNHKRIALESLKKIENFQGKTNPKLIKLSDEYATDVLGWKGYAYWLYVYSAIAKEFKEGWIPDNYYGKIIVPKFKGTYGYISDCKPLSKSIFNLTSSEYFPDIFYFVNGLWFSNNLEVVQLREIERFFINGEKFVFKVDDSLQGKGVSIISKKEDLQKITHNGVLQSYIKQHPVFNEMMPNSVATLRLNTYVNNDGEVKLASSHLRIGLKQDLVVKYASAIRIGVDPVTGVLDEFGYLTNWKPIEKHPDTDFVFLNTHIPNFKKSVQSVLDIHKRNPFCRIIGWDVVSDELNQIRIMEWNGGHNGIVFPEAIQGPIFKAMNLENLWRK